MLIGLFQNFRCGFFIFGFIRLLDSDPLRISPTNKKIFWSDNKFSSAAAAHANLKFFREIGDRLKETGKTLPLLSIRSFGGGWNDSSPDLSSRRGSHRRMERFKWLPQSLLGGGQDQEEDPLGEFDDGSCSLSPLQVLHSFDHFLLINRGCFLCS